MKKRSGILIAIVSVTAALFAAKAWSAGQNDAGCGVGSLIFKGNDPGGQILAATTNGTFGNQTFGITSGTLGCSGGGLAKMQSKVIKVQENFVVANFRDLHREMAAGGGEYVTSLASLMGCSKDATPAFSHYTQANYKVLFPTEDTAPQGMLQTLRATMGKDATLASSCTLL